MPADEALTLSDLSERSGVPPATIKFYMRERLLPPGDRASEKRAYYRTAHLRRLVMIRALRETGSLPVAVVREVLDALEHPSSSVVDVTGRVMDALTPHGEERGAESLRSTVAEVDAWLERQGLVVRPEASARRALARALLGLRAIRPEVTPDRFTPYLAGLRSLAEDEIACARMDRRHDDGGHALETTVLGAVLFEPVVMALRRILHEHLAAELVQDTPGPRRSARRR